MRGKSLILLLLALGCGLVASIGITQVMAKRTTDNQAVAEMEKIVVAVKDLPMGDPINTEWVKLEDWPKDKVPAGALTQLEDVDKRRPKSRVFAGSPVLDVQLFGKGETDNAVGSHIPAGYRVVSIEAAGITSSGGLIRPGDRVDLLLYVQANPSKQIFETAHRHSSRGQVLAVDGRFRLDSEDIDKVSPAKMVSLLLTPEQSQKVTLAAELGTLRLAMRSPEDQLQPKVTPSSAADLFGGSDGARRNKEAEPSKAVVTKSPGKSDDFLAFLRGKPQQAPLPVLRPCCNMRLITGTDVKDVRLEAMGETASNDGAGPDHQVWKPVSSALNARTEPVAEPSTTPVNLPPKTSVDLPPPKAKRLLGPEIPPRETKEKKVKASAASTGAS